MSKHHKPFLDAFEAKEPLKTRGDLFMCVRQKCLETETILSLCSNKFSAAVNHCLLKHYEVNELNSDLEKFAAAFSRDVPALVKKAKSGLEVLYRQSSKFMHIPLPDPPNICDPPDISDPPNVSDTPNVPPPSKKRSVDYSEASYSTKNRRARAIVSETDESDQNAIILAAIRCFEDQGKRSAAEALKIIYANPDDLLQLRPFLDKLESKKCRPPAILSPTKCLSVFCDLKFTRGQYESVYKNGNPEGVPQIWSPYSHVFIEKQKTHQDEPLRVREHEAIVPLFSLLKKTASRLLEIPAIDGMVDHLVELNDGNPINIQMISKFGLDGSSVII